MKEIRSNNGLLLVEEKNFSLDFESENSSGLEPYLNTTTITKQMKWIFAIVKIELCDYNDERIATKWMKATENGMEFLQHSSDSRNSDSMFCEDVSDDVR